MKNLCAVLLLCNAAWMTIYLYGEYASYSSKYHSSLIIFPIIFFAAALLIFSSSVLEMTQKGETQNDEN